MARTSINCKTFRIATNQSINMKVICHHLQSLNNSTTIRRCNKRKAIITNNINKARTFKANNYMLVISRPKTNQDRKAACWIHSKVNQSSDKIDINFRVLIRICLPIHQFIWKMMKCQMDLTLSTAIQVSSMTRLRKPQQAIFQKYLQDLAQWTILAKEVRIRIQINSLLTIRTKLWWIHNNLRRLVL